MVGDSKRGRKEKGKKKKKKTELFSSAFLSRPRRRDQTNRGHGRDLKHCEGQTREHRHTPTYEGQSTEVVCANLAKTALLEEASSGRRQERSGDWTLLSRQRSEYAGAWRQSGGRESVGDAGGFVHF
ncbi:hypothetical protein NMG60_11013032 [Bertholletia excelsa]